MKTSCATCLRQGWGRCGLRACSLRTWRRQWRSEMRKETAGAAQRHRLLRSSSSLIVEPMGAETGTRAANTWTGLISTGLARLPCGDRSVSGSGVHHQRAHTSLNRGDEHYLYRTEGKRPELWTLNAWYVQRNLCIFRSMFNGWVLKESLNESMCQHGCVSSLLSKEPQLWDLSSQSTKGRIKISTTMDGACWCLKLGRV